MGSSRCLSIYGKVAPGQSNLVQTSCNKEDDKQLIDLRSAHKANFPDNKWFNLCSVRGICINAPNSNGQLIFQNYGSTYNKMMWMFVPYSGAHHIKNRDGLLITNYANRKGNGNNIYAYNKGTYKQSQIWLPQMVNKTQFVLMNPYSSKCISLQGKVEGGKTGFKLYDCNKEDRNQLFDLQTPKPFNLPTDKYFNIHFKAGTCLKAPTNNGQRVLQGHCTTLHKSQWRFIQHKGAYLVKNKEKNIYNKKYLYLTNYANRKSNNNPVYAYTKGTYAISQIWLPIRANHNQFILMNPYSSRCLSIYGKVAPGQSNLV